MSEIPDLRSTVTGLLPDWLNSDLGDLLYLEGGFTNRNFRFRHQRDWYVLRVPGPNGPWTDRALEAHFYALARDLGQPLTAPVMVCDSDSGLMITRWVQGQLLADLRCSPEEMAAHLCTLHSALRKVSRAAPRTFERVYDPIVEARRLFAGAAPDPWLVRLAESQQWRPSQFALCHNDLNPWNLIRTPEGAWVTLDWEWLAWNDPLFDLIALHAGMGQDARALRQMADHYKSATQTVGELSGDALLAEMATDAELTTAQTAFWLRETAWAANELRVGHVRPEISAQYETGRARLVELTGR
jgi:thiamine kinase-like enzyme